MVKCDVEYINYCPEIHQQFPILKEFRAFEKNGIINLYLEGTSIFNEIIDDIGYDNQGKFLSVTVGEWHHSESGEFISNDEFFDLDEYESHLYDYVSIVVKIYVKGDYRSCYHNDFDKRVTISFIPYNIINF